MSDWIPALAEAIRQDRIDQTGGCTLQEARERARRYAGWLRHLDNITPGEKDRFEEDRRRMRLPGDLCFHLGLATVLTARVNAGKTNALSFLIEKAVAYRDGWDIYTNVPFPWSEDPELGIPGPPRLFAVGDMLGLLRGVGRTILAGRIPAVVIDETDQAFTSHDWASNESESWMRFIFVERHVRLRGPLLVYHLYEHVPLPLRRQGALRGSCLKVIVRNGQRWLIRLEEAKDPGPPFRNQPESILPYYTLGLRGFDLNVDMGDLETHLSGSGRKVAQQMLDYLDALEEDRAKEGGVAASEARQTHVEAVADVERAVAEQHHARLARREEIIEAFATDPTLTIRAAQARFNSGPAYLVDLRQIAKRRAAASVKATLPVTQGAA